MDTCLPRPRRSGRQHLLYCTLSGRCATSACEGGTSHDVYSASGRDIPGAGADWQAHPGEAIHPGWTRLHHPARRLRDRHPSGLARGPRLPHTTSPTPTSSRTSTRGSTTSRSSGTRRSIVVRRPTATRCSTTSISRAWAYLSTGLPWSRRGVRCGMLCAAGSPSRTTTPMARHRSSCPRRDCRSPSLNASRGAKAPRDKCGAQSKCAARSNDNGTRRTVVVRVPTGRKRRTPITGVLQRFAATRYDRCFDHCSSRHLPPIACDLYHRLSMYPCGPRRQRCRRGPQLTGAADDA